MEGIDEFEMKPLTSGLGFHQRSQELKKATAQSLDPSIQVDIPKDIPKPVRKSVQKTPTSLDDLLKALEQNTESRIGGADFKDSLDLKITEPLPRNRPKQQAYSQDPSVDVEMRKPLVKQREFKSEFAAEAVGARRGSGDTKVVVRLEPIPMSVTSAVVDVIAVLALTMIFLASLLTVTQINLLAVLARAPHDFATQLSLVALVVSVLQMYVILARSFFGCTLGEWAMDIQLGTNEQQLKVVYPLQVALRALVITLTGIILLPVLSLIVRRDVAAYLSGLQLYSKRFQRV